MLHRASVLLALLVAVLAVALGAALTAVSAARPNVLGLLRTFAATAAAGVVLTHLFPDALRGAGLWGALIFLFGLLGPLALHPLTERLASRRIGLSKARVALEAGFIGLLVHHVGDGLGIGAYAALPGGVLSHLDVIFALIAHTVPLVAVVTLAYRTEYGTRAALGRAGALALTSALGVVASFAVPAQVLEAGSGFIAALVSGVLLHVVTHDWLENLPSSEPMRLLDLAAAALGISLVLLGSHEPGEQGVALKLSETISRYAVQTAPFLLLGLALSFFLGDRLLRELSKLRRSLPGELGARLILSLGPEGLALGLASYGVVWTLAATLSTTLVPLVAAAAGALGVAIAGEAAAKHSAARIEALPEPPIDRFRRFDRATALWAASVAVAGVIACTLNDSALYGSLGRPGELLTATLVGCALPSGGPSVVALSALTLKGLSPGGALLLAVMSSALGTRVIIALGRLLGVRALVPVLTWLTCLTAAIAVGVNQVAPVPSPVAFPVRIGQGALCLVVGLILLRAERVGVRRWLAGWLESGHHHGHSHHEHHAPGAHSSEMPNGNAAT